MLCLKNESPFISKDDKECTKGLLIKIMPYEGRYFASLVSMYDTYYPPGSVQGFPLTDTDKRHCWVSDIVSHGTNLVALQEDDVIGHATLFFMRTSWVECFILIHQDFQKQGIGTVMTPYTIDWASRKTFPLFGCVWTEKTVWQFPFTINWASNALHQKTRNGR